MAEYDLLCPKCRKKIEPCFQMWLKYSWIRLDLPYFLCGGCRTAYIDKPLVRKAISNWRKWAGKTAKSIPYGTLYEEIINSLQDTLRYHASKLGYREARFIRKTR